MGHLLVAKEARSAVVVPGCASSSCVLAGISLYAMGCPAQSPGIHPSALPLLNAFWHAPACIGTSQDGILIFLHHCTAAYWCASN